MLGFSTGISTGGFRSGDFESAGLSLDMLGLDSAGADVAVDVVLPGSTGGGLAAATRDVSTPGAADATVFAESVLGGCDFCGDCVVELLASCVFLGFGTAFTGNGPDDL